MIAVVGAGVAGVSAACALREMGYDGTLRVFGSETAVPYERPTLSKSFLVDEEVDEPPALRSATTLAELGITLELGAEVVAIDSRQQTLALAQGREARYDQLLLTTGAEPRRLDLLQGELGGVYYLRELADAQPLRRALRGGGSVAIVGGGVIGLEIAASAAQLGAAVTVLEASTQLMGRVAPRGFAELLEGLHRVRGVTIKTATRPIGLDRDSRRVRRVVLKHGDFVPAESVIVGVGAVPRTGLAARAGLAVDDGIVVDEHFRSSNEQIFAAGDVASVFHVDAARHIRTEHWRAAEEQGRQAAACMLGKGEPYRHVPWMWSDQHDLHLQSTGFGFSGATVVRRGHIDARSGVAYLGIREDRLVAACGVSVGTGIARVIRAAQMLIERRVAIAPDQLADPDLDLRRMALAKAG